MTLERRIKILEDTLGKSEDKPPVFIDNFANYPDKSGDMGLPKNLHEWLTIQKKLEKPSPLGMRQVVLVNRAQEIEARRKVNDNA